MGGGGENLTADQQQNYLAGQPNRVLQPGSGTRAIIQWMKENALDPDAAGLQKVTRPRVDPDYIASNTTRQGIDPQQLAMILQRLGYST